jgi:branched-chain amino acid transport system ATP-binding protein
MCKASIRFLFGNNIMDGSILKIENITKHFGGVYAVNNCTLEVKEGTITGLIGPNGAGKTTLFNVITGFYKPDSGRVFFKGEDITGFDPHIIFGKKIFRTFQIAREYREMSVLENLLLIPKNQSGERLWNAWFRGKRIRSQENVNIKRALDILKFFDLDSKKDIPAKYLSGGEKKLLEIGRMMMVDLEMVLLDEPGAGVPPLLQNKIMDYIRKLSREHGLTLFIVEHDMDIIMKICDTIIVMSDGTKLAQGTPKEIRNNEAVIEAYLGKQNTIDEIK